MQMSVLATHEATPSKHSLKLHVCSPLFHFNRTITHTWEVCTVSMGVFGVYYVHVYLSLYNNLTALGDHN